MEDRGTSVYVWEAEWLVDFSPFDCGERLELSVPIGWHFVSTASGIQLENIFGCRLNAVDTLRLAYERKDGFQVRYRWEDCVG